MVGPWTIYALFHPETENMFYIGCTERKLSYRLTAHINGAHTTDICKYCYLLNKQGSKPIIKELCICNNHSVALELERALIMHYSQYSDLVNSAYNLTKKARRSYGKFDSRLKYSLL